MDNNNVFFIGDTHFNHKNILDYEDRPFSSLDEMAHAMIKNWNIAVDNNAKIFHLGDFAFGNKGMQVEIGKQLKGYKVLILGNHDRYNPDFYVKAGFSEVYKYPIIIDNFWILSHYPMYVNQNMPYANIFAHVHGNPAFKDYSEQTFCVSVERSHLNYTPISFNKIKELMGITKESI